MINLFKKKSTYLKKEEFTSLNPIVVLDVGCRWGFADKFIQNNSLEDMLIYGFDPDIEECKRLEGIYNNDNIKLVPVGLANKPGKRTLYLTKEPACSSLYKPNEKLTRDYPALDCAKETNQIEVNISTLDIWTKKEDLKYIDYMKIDTQGAELSILKGGKNILRTISFLEIEVEFNPIYDGQPTFSDVDLFLREYGFVLWKLSNIVHYSKNNESDKELGTDSINYDHHRLEYPVRGGQIYWADAFYIKKKIVETSYNKGEIEKIRRHSKIAEMLGFLDLKDRLDKEYL